MIERKKRVYMHTKVNINLLSLGTHSKKIVPSTGRLPPIPKPRAKKKRQNTQNVGEKVMARPKRVVMAKVSMKTGRLPT